MTSEDGVPIVPTSSRKRVFTEIFRIALLCGVLMQTAGLDAQLTPADWLRADAATVRLMPSAFSKLPSSIRMAMERRGCTVPQPVGSDRPRNVISGHFIHAMQTDWAVLCSRARRSSILVFSGKDFSTVDELAEAADAEYLQTVPGGRIGFSRALLVATPTIVKRIRVEDGPKPRIIDHDGIVDAFEGKGSMVWYRSGEKWIVLPGSD